MKKVVPFLFLLAASTTTTTTKAVDLSDIFGINCLDTNDADELFACLDQTLNEWLDKMGEMLNLDCLMEAGPDMDKLRVCAEETAVNLMQTLGEITGIDCLENGQDLPAMEKCAREELREVAPCFDTTDTDAVIACANGTIDNVFGIMEEVPPCVEESLEAMAACAKEKAEECAESCQDLSFAPLQELSYTEMTCSALQSGILTPICAVASCCSPCVKAIEDVAMCMTNNVLNLNEGDCNLFCSANRRLLGDGFLLKKKNLGSTSALKRALSEITDEPETPIVHCGTDIKGERRTLETVENLLDCSMAEYLETIEQNAPQVTDAPAATDPPAENPQATSAPASPEGSSTRDDSGSSRASGSALLAVVLVIAASFL